MNEDALFSAYRNMWKTEAEAREAEELAIMRIEDRTHSIKCVIESCPTMIADWAGRVVCRFHERQRRERGTI